MADYETLDWSVSDRILTLMLNRPDQLNAFTVTMAHELVDAYDRASADDGGGAIGLTRAGRAFCAGMDLSAEAAGEVGGNVFGLDEALRPTWEDVQERLDDPEVLHGVRDTGGLVSLAVFRCTKPVVAAVNGPAVGIGATMLLPMDVRLASDRARVGFVFGRLGIVPEAASTWFLPRIVGISRALEWVYSAEVLTAEQAHEGGLVRSVLPPDELLPAAQELARSFVRDRSPVAVALARQMMWRNSAAPHPLDAHRVDSLAMFYTSTGDGKEGVRAFREKRPPRFTSRASQMPPFHPWPE